MIRSQQSVAIKSISKEKIKKDLYLLRRELEVMRQIDHPNVIKYYATYEDAKYLHIVMELCTGGDLLDKLLSVGTLTEAQVANIMRSLLLAVNYLHGMGICHRDLKPENFLFESGNPEAPIKLIDFGMAIKLGNVSDMNSLVGTPYYLAPEVLRGNYGMHCDIWSLGVVMYLLLSGCYPFEGDDMKDLFRQIKKAEYNFEDTDWESISMDAKDLITKMLTKTPTDRITAEGALKHPWLTKQGERSPHSVPPSVLTAIKKHKTPKKLQKEVMKVMIKFMSIQDIEELRQAFLELDQGNTGYITISDIASAMENAGFDMQVEELKSTNLHRNCSDNKSLTRGENPLFGLFDRNAR